MEGKHLSTVKNMLNRRLCIGVTDGRTFVGRFHCMDKQGNILLHDSVEYRKEKAPSETESVRSILSPKDRSVLLEQRRLGLTLIPVETQTLVFVECHDGEELSTLKI